MKSRPDAMGIKSFSRQCCDRPGCGFMVEIADDFDGLSPVQRTAVRFDAGLGGHNLLAMDLCDPCHADLENKIKAAINLFSGIGDPKGVSMAKGDFEIMVADPGEDVQSFALRMMVAATISKGVVLGEFNQHALVARPGTELGDVLRPFNDSQRQSYANGRAT